MRKPDTLAWAVLIAGAAEQFEDALHVVRRYATSVVGHVNTHQTSLAATGDGNPAGAPILQILQRIFDKI
jgi:hypothetical protein